MTERKEILYQMVIGKPLTLSKSMFTPLKNEADQAIAIEDYYDKNDANAYLFDKHQITFSIKMSSTTSDANKASFKLYNVDDKILNYLITNKDNKLVITFAAGDNAQGLKELFNGTVEDVVVDDTSETRIITLKVLDGITNIKNAKSVRRWPRGTPYETVIRDLANDMKVPINRMSAISGVTQSPITMMGPTYKLIRSQLEKLGYDYSIDKGRATIIPKDKQFSKQVSYISKETGLIGKVTPFTDATKNTSTSNSSKSGGIQFNCLLDGNLAPNETVYVKDGDYDGAYKITDVNISGDYEGNDWTCSVTAVETSGEIEDV